MNQSDSLMAMRTTLTEFQRQFRRAREAADRGESVLIEGDGVEYVFQKHIEPKNPFEDLEGVFGVVTRLEAPDKPARQKVRERLRAKLRGR